MNETEKRKLRAIRDRINELLGETQKAIAVPKEVTPEEATVKALTSAFDEWYKSEFGLGLTWQVKDRTAMQKIMKTLLQVAKDNPQEDAIINGDYILRMWIQLLTNLKEVDKWVYDNVSPSTLLSRIDQVIKKMISSKSAERNEHEQSIKDRLEG